MKKGMKRYFTTIITGNIGQLNKYVIRMFYAENSENAWERAYKLAEKYPNGIVYDVRTGGKIWVPEGMKEIFENN